MTDMNQAKKLQGLVESRAKRYADKIAEDGEVCAIVGEAMVSVVAKRLRPIFLMFALQEELGAEFDEMPEVNAGPDGTNNPDRFIKGVTKKGVIKYGTFWENFAYDLPVCKQHMANIAEYEAKDKAEHLKDIPPSRLEALKRTEKERLRAAKECVIQSVSLYQMKERLEEYDTIEVTFASVKDTEGNDVLDETTTRPVIIRERYWKLGKDGQPVVDSEGDKVAVYTDKIRYLSVGDFIGLEPKEASTMDGGFSFDNLFKAAAAKRKREQDEQARQNQKHGVGVANVEEWFKTIANTGMYIANDRDGWDKRLASIRQVMQKDETRLVQVCDLAAALDTLWNEFKDRYHEVSAKMHRDAASFNETKKTA